MKILVTGIGGQLGYDCVRILESDYDVTGIDRQTIDLLDSVRLEEFIRDISPDVIVNCAAFTDVEACTLNDNTHFISNINIAVPKHLAQLCNLQGCKLIHISTDYVFDGSLDLPKAYVEHDFCYPINVYGVSKHLSEKVILANLSNSVIIRTSGLYGINGHNFIRAILKKHLIDKQNDLQVVDDQYTSPTSTLALARQIKLIIDNPDIVGIVHASCHDYCSWYDFATEVFKLLELSDVVKVLPISTAYLMCRTRRPVNAVLDNSILSDLNKDIMPTWKEALIEFLNLNKLELLKDNISC